jgi:hypothetical protein
MSNLGNLIKHDPQFIQIGMEHIAPYILLPWWKLPATTEISLECKDKAAEAHQQQLRQISTLIIYTNRLDHNDHIGAAIYAPTTNVVKGEYMGTDDTHNVYAAATPSTTSLNTTMGPAQNRSIQSMARIKWQTKCKTLAKYESIS